MSSALPHASNHGLSSSTISSDDGSFARSAATRASLRVTPPINNTRRREVCPFSRSATTLPAMLSCSVFRMSAGVASRRLSLCVTSDLQCTVQREVSGTILPENESSIALSIPSPIRLMS